MWWHNKQLNVDVLVRLNSEIMINYDEDLHSVADRSHDGASFEDIAKWKKS